MEWAQVVDAQQIFYHPLFTQELLSITDDIIVGKQAGVTID